MYYGDNIQTTLIQGNLIVMLSIARSHLYTNSIIVISK